MTSPLTSVGTVYTPSDMYEQLLQIVSGKRGCLSIKKKFVKAAGMQWKFVEQSCEILGLKLVRDGKHGYMASK